MSLWSTAAERVPMTGQNMHIKGLGYGFTRSIWLRCFGPKKHRRKRSSRPWAPGHLNGDESGWSGRVQLRPTGRGTRRCTGLQPQVMRIFSITGCSKMGLGQLRHAVNVD